MFGLMVVLQGRALLPVLPLRRRLPPQEHRGRRRRRVRGCGRGWRHGDVPLRRRERRLRRLRLRLEEAAEDPLEPVARRQVEQWRGVPG